MAEEDFSKWKETCPDQELGLSTKHKASEKGFSIIYSPSLKEYTHSKSTYWNIERERKGDKDHLIIEIWEDSKREERRLLFAAGTEAEVWKAVSELFQ